MNRVNLVLEHFLMGLFIGLNYHTLKGTSESKTRRKMTLEDLFLSILHSNSLRQPLIVMLLENTYSINTGEKVVLSNSCSQPCCPNVVPNTNNSTSGFRDFANISVSHSTGDQRVTGSNKM